MSSPYPILDNRPIDKWKVTELKEELKRRKLTTRGLKEDLIKRLDEALRVEKENDERVARAAAVEVQQDVEMTPKIGEVTPVAAAATPVAAEATIVAAGFEAFPTATTPVAAEITPAFVENAALQTTPVQAKVVDYLVKNGDDLNEKVDDVRNVGGFDDSAVDVKQQDAQEGYENDETAKLESGIIASDPVVAESTSSDILHKPDVDLEIKVPSTGLNDDDSKLRPENDDVKAQLTDGLHDTSASNNQVSEVSPVTGLEVKSDCISTDSLSHNEKIELKDNAIADDVKLEHNVNKSQEMVEPSSVGGESHPMDVEEPLEQKASVGDRDDNNVANSDMTKGNDNIEVDESEKLNLDRSSGDDSIEEEADTKQTESNHSDEVVNKSEKHEIPAEKVEIPADIMGNDLDTGKGDLPESESQPVVTSEKRKLPVNDQEAAGNIEPVKRQRRWNSENIKVPEVQTSTIAPTTTTTTTTPKSTSLKCNFSRSDSTASEDGPKERVVPPSQKDPTNSLRIDNFLRPFTLKAVQELLGKYGTITSFWMDHIKTHCYVSYSSVEDAVATRGAVYNLKWPPNGGRLLVAEFVGPEEVKAKVEAPQTPATPAAAPSQPATKPLPQPSIKPQGSKTQPQQPPTALPPPPPLSNPTPARERLQPPPPPPIQEQQEPPILTLDDLFKKTKATPRIYYLPLSDEQVAAKVAARGKGDIK